MDEEIQADGSAADTGGSEAMRAELLDECEEQFGILQKLQNEIILADTESVDGESSEAMNRLNAMMTELEQWQEMEPKLLSTNPEILLILGKEELQKHNSQLEMALSCSRAKRDALKDLLQREQGWLKEKEEVLNAVTQRVNSLRDENERISEQSVLQDMKRKITKVKDYYGNLMETLSDMLAEHFPLPSQTAVGTKKKRGPTVVPGTALISLSEILEKLTNKTLETPHEPYITVDDSFWPPYIEMLLRNGIAVRHPEDCSKRYRLGYEKHAGLTAVIGDGPKLTDAFIEEEKDMLLVCKPGCTRCSEDAWVSSKDAVWFPKGSTSELCVTCHLEEMSEGKNSFLRKSPSILGQLNTANVRKIFQGLSQTKETK